MVRARIAVGLGLGLLGAACGGEPGVEPDAARVPDAGPDAAPPWDPIDEAVLHEVDITIAPADLVTFDQDQTMRVPCDVTWDGVALPSSGCRKKGFSGSVDSVLGKPAFSIKFDAWVDGQELGPFDKMNLNNALQDPSLLHEHLAYEVFRGVGVPAHRTAFAQVTLNGAPRGIYVALEPVDKEFLRSRFGAASDDGNLYEASSVDFALDPDGMELKDPEGRSRADLDAAAAAVRDASDEAFVAEVGGRIDLDNFGRHYAAEMLTSAEDGHAIGRNNYYLYHRPDTDRFVFLPHGQDVTFDDPGLEADYPPAARLAARVHDQPARWAAVAAVIDDALAPGGAFEPDALAARADAAADVITSTDRDDAFTAGDLAAFARRLPELKAQLAWRVAFLRGEAAPLRCGDGVVHRGEQCDDGNEVDGDGCDATCRPECVDLVDGAATWRLCPAAWDRPTAAARCGDAGGALVVPASADEAAALALIVRRALGNVDVWIGVTDAAADGAWLDDQGAPAPYLGFAGSEPNGGEAEACAVLDTGTAGGWRDQPCDVGYASVCRM